MHRICRVCPPEVSSKSPTAALQPDRVHFKLAWFLKCLKKTTEAAETCTPKIAAGKIKSLKSASAIYNSKIKIQ